MKTVKGQSMNSKALVLIVDDQEMNRALLSDMLDMNYQIVEAADGLEAMQIIEDKTLQIACVLLDVRMPKMDGFEVLSKMKKDKLLEQIPVIMITSDDSAESAERGYALGAADYINRPFNDFIVKKRVENTIFLHQKTRTLTELVAEQVAEKEKNNANMITILSTIVEFRNGESGMHTLRIRIITEILLECIMEKYPEYQLTHTMIADISNAAALHDIGKIAIPEQILNKPGKLTNEEFDVMKTHAAQGADLLYSMKDVIEYHQMFQYAGEICRWHHERWNGRGYPDGLAGDNIPIGAQVVSIADVYDALTSERVYKAAYSHEKALDMIYNGECGQFNPKLLDAMREVQDSLPSRIERNSTKQDQLFDTQKISNEIISSKSVLSDRSITLLEEERLKYQVLAALSNEIIFDYDVESDTITFSEQGYLELDLPMLVEDFSNNFDKVKVLSEKEIKSLFRKVEKTTPERPIARERFEIILPGVKCSLREAGDSGETSSWYEIVLRSMWSRDIEPRIKGVIGKITNINDHKVEIQRLENLAARDTLTHLYNRITAQNLIERYLNRRISKQGVFIFLDVDNFKALNDSNGHRFGDNVLSRIAEIISYNIRNDDIAARMGGDEFIIFLKDIESEKVARKQVERIFKAFSQELDNQSFTISMGISVFPKDGTSYHELLEYADQAMYEAKKQGRNNYIFYNG